MWATLVGSAESVSAVVRNRNRLDRRIAQQRQQTGGGSIRWPIRRPAPGVCRRWPEIAWSGERALPGDVPADDEGLDFSSSFVGDQGLHVAQVTHDMEVEQDAVAA